MMVSPTPDQFQKLLFEICTRDTSADPDHWTPKNPLWGHCAVAALLAQDIFGGLLLRASLLDVPEFAAMKSHYWNLCPGGIERDFTRAQFQNGLPSHLAREHKDRDYLLSNPETRRRYELLVRRFQERIAKS